MKLQVHPEWDRGNIVECATGSRRLFMKCQFTKKSEHKVANGKVFRLTILTLFIQASLISFNILFFVKALQVLLTKR